MNRRVVTKRFALSNIGYLDLSAFSLNIRHFATQTATPPNNTSERPAYVVRTRRSRNLAYTFSFFMVTHAERSTCLPLGTTAGPDQNGPMHPNRILLYFLIAASLAVDLAFVGLLSDRNGWPAISVALLLGLAGGQINLATLWGVLGCRHAPWRIAVLLVVPIAWSFAIATSAPGILPGYETPVSWAVHFLTQTALLTSILFLIRLCGGRLTLVGRPPEDATTRRGQFALRYLFAWLTSTAIILSALKTTFDRAKLPQNQFDWEAILILGFVIAMLGLIFLWIVLDTRNVRRRAIAAGLTALPTAGVIAYTVYLVHGIDFLVAILVLWFVAAVYSALATIILRVAELRVFWFDAGCLDASASPPTAQSPPAQARPADNSA